MQQVIIVLSAAISFISLFIYDFLCVCRIIKQEQIVEKIWREIIPNEEYDEIKVFVFIRPIFLYISAISFLFSSKLLLSLVVFEILLYGTPILAILGTMRNNNFNNN